MESTKFVAVFGLIFILSYPGVGYLIYKLVLSLNMF